MQNSNTNGFGESLSSDFFNQIPKIENFIGAIDDRNFVSAPADWIVVVADLRNSTKAVAQGRYKDVNMIGGAVICAVQNATGSRDWPFVFGGDGATVLIGSEALPSVWDALVRTRTLAREDFDLDLRIGFVPVTDIVDSGASLLVARYEISPGNCLALFGGGGVELADRLVKADEACERYAVPEYVLPGLPDLTGLSCRWESLNSKRGRILCILVRPLGTEFQHRQAILTRFLVRLTEAIGTELVQSSPVTANSLRLSWPPKGLSAEAKATRASKTYFRRTLEIVISSFIQWGLDRFKLKSGHYDAKLYREELCKNSDYCKFDDVLRMVLDCDTEQVAKIRHLLEDLKNTGDIDYGLCETERALITCLLFDLESSQHVHFVDGEEGGFWSASMDMKRQMASHHATSETGVSSFDNPDESMDSVLITRARAYNGRIETATGEG